MYGVDLELRDKWGFEDVFYTQETSQRCFAKYRNNRNTFIPSELFNHGDDSWPSVEDKIEIHLLASAITLILNKHAPLITINLENCRRKLDSYTLRLAIGYIVSLFATEDWREVLVKGLHYGCTFEPECHDIIELVEKAIFNNLPREYNYTFDLDIIYLTLRSLLCTKSWYCNKPRDAIIDPNIIVMANSKLWHWTKKILRNLRKIGPEMLYEKAWQDNNGYIENTMLPFFLDKDVIPSPQLGLKPSIDYE